MQLKVGVEDLTSTRPFPRTDMTSPVFTVDPLFVTSFQLTRTCLDLQRKGALEKHQNDNHLR
jgi:hypothetical protein